MAWLRDPAGTERCPTPATGRWGAGGGSSGAPEAQTGAERPVAEVYLAQLLASGAGPAAAVVGLVASEPEATALIVEWALVRYQREHFTDEAERRAV